MSETEHEAGEGPQRSRINRCSLVNEKRTNKHTRQMSGDDNAVKRAPRMCGKTMIHSVTEINKRNRDVLRCTK